MMAEIGETGSGNEPDIAGADHGDAHGGSKATGWRNSGPTSLGALSRGLFGWRGRLAALVNRVAQRPWTVLIPPLDQVRRCPPHPNRVRRSPATMSFWSTAPRTFFAPITRC